MEALCVKKCRRFRRNISPNVGFNWKKGKILLDIKFILMSPKLCFSNTFVILSAQPSENFTIQIMFQVYKDLVDFDNHLDDITQDYLNVQMNMVIDQAL